MYDVCIDIVYVLFIFFLLEQVGTIDILGWKIFSRE